MPCLDNLWEKCTWEFEFIVPKSLEDDSTSMDIDGEEIDDGSDDHPTVVICSGELVEKVTVHSYFEDLNTELLSDCASEQSKQSHLPLLATCSDLCPAHCLCCGTICGLSRVDRGSRAHR